MFQCPSCTRALSRQPPAKKELSAEKEQARAAALAEHFPGDSAEAVAQTLELTAAHPTMQPRASFEVLEEEMESAKQLPDMGFEAYNPG